MDFMQEDVEKALRGKEIPTTGVFYYDVPDLAMVPPLRKRNNSNYLKTLEKAMDGQGIGLQSYLRVSEVVYCL